VHHAKASPSLSERTRFPVDHQLFAIRPACFTPLALPWRDKTRSGRRVSLTAVHREQEAEGEETCGARRDPGMCDRDSFGGAGGQGRASGQLLGPRRRQIRDSRPDSGAGEARCCASGGGVLRQPLCRVAGTRLVNKYNLFVLEALQAWRDPPQGDPKTIHHRGYGAFVVDGETIKLESEKPWRDQAKGRARKILDLSGLSGRNARTAIRQAARRLRSTDRGSSHICLRKP